MLFDEIEKAHRNVLDILLQVLDDARLTDGHGRTVDFSNCIIIMTSNIGSDLISSEGCEKSMVMDRLQASFRPEFLNRLDDIVIFHGLDKDHLCNIIRTNVLRDINERLSDRRIRLTASGLALDLLVNESYNPAYGARPLRRHVEKRIVTELARLVIRENLQDAHVHLLTTQEMDSVSLGSGKKTKIDQMTPFLVSLDESLVFQIEKNPLAMNLD